MTVLIQAGILLAIAAYLAALRTRMRQRNGRSWESLISRLQPVRGLQSLSNQFPWKEGLNAGPDETWEKIRGTRGLWSMFRNAGVMMEIADFAARSDMDADPTLIRALRADAMQIRFAAMSAIVQMWWNHAGEGTRIGAFRVVSMYTGMASRMTELIRVSASGVLPEFVAAL